MSETGLLLEQKLCSQFMKLCLLYAVWCARCVMCMYIAFKLFYLPSPAQWFQTRANPA